MKQKVVVIVGPTASGKTKLSIELAKRINGEIVSCDSMQIYKDMTIGTAKPTIEEQSGIKHYLIDYVLPNVRYTVSDYKKDAENAISEILKNEKNPIIVGGTGLYADSLINEIEYPKVKTDSKYREKLEKEAQENGLSELYNMACKIDSEAMKKISQNDKKRILRVLELYHDTGKTKTELEIESRKKETPYDYRIFAINIPRDILYKRIENRVDQMIENGLIEEVKNLMAKYSEFPTSMQGIGYKEIRDLLNNKVSKEEAIENIKKETRHYAKRQITWFKKNPKTIWLDGLKEVDYNVKIIMNNL